MANRAFLYFSVFVLSLISFASSASEPIPATQSTVPAQAGPRVQHNSTWYPTADAACHAYVYYYPSYSVLLGQDSLGRNQYKCRRVSDNFEYPIILLSELVCSVGTLSGTICSGVLTCPTGYTLNGAMCYPDAPCPMYGTPDGNTAPLDKPASCNCPAGHEWVPMNGCRKKCTSPYGIGEVVNAGWPFVFPKDQLQACSNGCVVQQGGGESFVYDDGSVSSPATNTGWACQTSNETPPGNAPELPQKPKEPPCGASEGVLTSSSGKVACIPEGTPSPRKPDVKVREKTETYPDNSKKTTTETKTTDPKTNASHTHTTTTSTGGMAGPAGTTEGKESETGDGNGGDGDCEGEDCGEGEYQPGEFPETEGLYTKKYEDGIQGVLDARYAEVQNSQLFSLVGKLIPTNVPNAGTCTPFSLSMNLGAGMNYGGGTIEFPCYVWTFIRVVMLISALLLARRLIFGG